MARMHTRWRVLPEMHCRISSSIAKCLPVCSTTERRYWISSDMLTYASVDMLGKVLCLLCVFGACGMRKIVVRSKERVMVQGVQVKHAWRSLWENKWVLRTYTFHIVVICSCEITVNIFNLHLTKKELYKSRQLIPFPGQIMSNSTKCVTTC